MYAAEKMIVNPIIDWTHSDIWGYINSEKIETCELYQCGYDRIGCIGCAMDRKKRYKEFADFPEYRNCISTHLPECWKNVKDVEKNVNGSQEKKYFYGGWKTRTCRDR